MGENFVHTAENEPQMIEEVNNIQAGDVELVKGWIRINRAKPLAFCNDHIYTFDAKC